MSVLAVVLVVVLLALLILTSNAWTLISVGGWPVAAGAVIGALLAWPSCTVKINSDMYFIWVCTAEHFPLHHLTATATATATATEISTPEWAVSAQVMLQGAAWGGLVAFGLLVVFFIGRALVRGK
jgi:hypothetical protein